MTLHSDNLFTDQLVEEIVIAALISLALFWLVGPARVACCQNGGCVGYYCDHWVQTPGGRRLQDRPLPRCRLMTEVT